MNGLNHPRAMGAPVLRALLMATLALAALLLPTAQARGAEPSPEPVALGDVRMGARPLLGGAARPGAWMTVVVQLENDGPAISGELEVTGGQLRDSRYFVPVELATGARQQHVLYAQPDWTGRGMVVNLVDDGALVLSQRLATKVVDAWTPTIVVVAEHPEGIIGDIRTGTTQANMNPPVILTVAATDLPTRVEAWSAIDRLVWQDVDSSRLSEDQLEALRGWIGAGGRLVVAGGTTGTTTLGGLPPDLLPFVPAGMVDVSPADLEPLVGPLPDDTASLPAVAGILDEGAVLGRTGDQVFAAQRTTGQGSVTLLGIDPSVEPIGGTATAAGLWRRFLPVGANGAAVNPLLLTDDTQIAMALSNLPAVDLPDLGILFALLLLYIVLIGPLNYLVLRRLDRREWAWLTMPLLVGVFAAAAYALGATLKGTDTIVNQVGIVRTATGTDRGIGQVYVGIFSPGRAAYDVRVSDGALLTNPGYLQASGQTPTPLDVQLGEPSRLRGFEMGYSTLRTFRAEAPVRVPRLDADLEYREGVLTGTLSNRSDLPLEDVTVMLGRTVQPIGALPAGGSVPVSLRVARSVDDRSLSELVYGPYPVGGVRSRTEMTRRMVLDQLWWNSGMGYGSVQPGPLVMAWTSGPELAIDMGGDAKKVGDTVHLYPATMRVVGPAIFPNALMGRAVLTADANEATDQGSSLSLSRGSMAVEWRPLGFSGPFRATNLSLMFTQGETPVLTGQGTEVEPLPLEQQPPQDDPLAGVTFAWGPDGTLVRADDGTGDDPIVGAAGVPWDGIPDIQLFDRVSQSWVELPHPVARRELRVKDPARYVDETGAFQVRMVNRGGQDMTMWFMPLVRLEGETS